MDMCAASRAMGDYRMVHLFWQWGQHSSPA
jgi:hypothetical protein